MNLPPLGPRLDQGSSALPSGAGCAATETMARHGWHALSGSSGLPFKRKGDGSTVIPVSCLPHLRPAAIRDRQQFEATRVAPARMFCASARSGADSA